MERIDVHCTAHHLEGRLHRGLVTDGAVVCHPHPLYGGSMDNNVVLALEDTYRQRGWTTLRFNFRGVGQSTGVYEEGDGEAEDTLCVRRFLKEIGVERIHLAGYSFGAWVALKACRSGFVPESLALVSPPVNFLDFSGLSIPSCPTWVVVGDNDTFAEVARVRSWVEAQRAQGCRVQLDVCPGGDHFYWGREHEIRRLLGAFLTAFWGSDKNS